MIAQDLDGSEDSSAKLIAVWGPAGAPGRSTLAINLSAEFACLGLRVLLVDADTYGGSIAGYLELFDETPGFLAACRLAAMDELDDVELARLAHDYDVAPTARVTILSGIVNSARWPEVSATRVRKALSDLRPRFDVIVADVGFNLEEDEEIASDVTAPRRNQATLELLHRADAVIGVASGDVVGLARYIHAHARLGELVTTQHLQTVVNRVVPAEAAAARHTLARFAGISDSFAISEDISAFRRCSRDAAPLCVIAPQSTVRKQVQTFASLIAQRGGITARPIAKAS